MVESSQGMKFEIGIVVWECNTKERINIPTASAAGASWAALIKSHNILYTSACPIPQVSDSMTIAAHIRHFKLNTQRSQITPTT